MVPSPLRIETQDGSEASSSIRVAPATAGFGAAAAGAGFASTTTAGAGVVLTGALRAGSEADIRLTAYKQRTTPLVSGEVTYVSGDRLVDEQTKQAYYVVHVNVPQASLAQAGNLRMQAGMPAEIFIRTDSRTTLDYLLAPVTSYFRRATREPL